MPTSPPSTRLSNISSHLLPSTTTPTTHSTMAAPARPPITCHVLDTSIGRPAANIPVTLSLYTSSASATTTLHTFTSTTNSDGRVTSWTPASSPSSSDLRSVFDAQGDQKWSLRFDTDAYFEQRGIESFYPEVEVKFWVREKRKVEHFHVPVLLAVGLEYVSWELGGGNGLILDVMAIEECMVLCGGRCAVVRCDAIED
jgi:5-hydroxyisourate hydrolase